MSMKGKGGKGGKGGSGGKSRSGGGSVVISKTKARATAAIDSAILTLRKALFDDGGKNKDVTRGIAPAFLRYDRNGLDVTITWKAKLSKDEVKWAFSNIKESMEEKYDNSEYGWDDEDKMEQLTGPEGRFLVVREALQEEEGQKEAASQQEGEDKGGKKAKTPKGALVAIAHFRFSVEGEWVDQMVGEPMLALWDVFVDASSRRKGLGRHLMMLLELIARREGMHVLALPVQLGDEETLGWLHKATRGYDADDSLVAPEDIGFQVMAKRLIAPPAVAPAEEEAAKTVG